MPVIDSRPAQRPGVDSRAPTTRAVIPTPRERAVETALTQLGKPYRYGGADPTGFDCSGLIWYAFRGVGIDVPRTTASMWRQLPQVAKGDVQRGDLLFFNIDGKPAHVGLFLGDGQFVHAPASGRTVTIADLDAPYYRNAWLRGARIPLQSR